MTPGRSRGRSFPEALACALRGVGHAARTQRHFRAQLVIAAGTLLFAAWSDAPAVELAVLVLAVALVLGMELFNTAVEMLTDLLHPDHGPAAAVVKDVSAGGVLVAALLALAVGVLTLAPRVIGLPSAPDRGVPAVLGLACLALLAAGATPRRSNRRP